MNKTMKKNSEKKLPKFKANTLGADELCQVTGGMQPETGATACMCHSDGIEDGDGSGGGVA
jgi:hypothetical protein